MLGLAEPIRCILTAGHRGRVRIRYPCARRGLGNDNRASLQHTHLGVQQCDVIPWHHFLAA